jgi:V/A-type H+-transporting ATPase subunit I
MAVLQMQRMSICALKKDRKAILEKLQRMGNMEIDNILKDDEDFQRMDTVSARLNFDKAATLTDQALDILQQYAPVKQSMLDSLAGKALIDSKRYQQMIHDREELLKVAKKIQSLDKEKAEQKANILKIENSMEALTPWLPLDAPMDYAGTEHIAMLIGTLPGVYTLENVYTMLATQAPDVEADIHIITVDADTTYLAAFCLRDCFKEVEDGLRALGFAKPAQMVSNIPTRAKDEMEAHIAKLNQRILDIEKEVVRLSSYREELRLVADYYRVRAAKYEVLGNLPQSERTFVISGYVPQKEVAKVQKALEGKYDCVVDIEDIKEDEEPPVLLQNNAFSASTEGILEAFGLPRKGEIDPTTIMSFFYVFFFGMMLSDAAYGAIVAIACGVLIMKFPRMEQGMKKAIQMFFWCGVSTLIWGVLFGGYFGDVVTIVARVFFGREVVVPALWFVPLDEPMRLLMYCMLFGVIHLYVGLGLKGYMCIRDKRYTDFFCDVVLWYMLLTGLILMLLPTEMFASIAQMDIVFPPALSALAKWLSILGALGILFMSGRSSKNFGLRIALGAYDLYNISGWLSDVLSYSRLLALGLATGVIASVINQMGSMGGKSIFGVILFIVVFIFGHLFNLAINLLGAYVHTNRLQFVEFFGKFYEGGGRAFNPFKENTKYTEIKEETNL